MPTIGEAARASGLTVETIRYYERTGVVPRPPRSASGRRIYGAAEIARLRMIRSCRHLGFPLADARALLGLAGGNPDACGTVKAIAEAHLAELRRKRRELAAVERLLVELIAGCREGSESCPALETLARA